MEIEDLTPEQIKAFNALKRAYKRCEKSGILFANWYGHLTAYNSDIVKGAGDKTMYNLDYLFVEHGNNTSNYIELPNEWADDEIDHGLELTKKGLELINQ